jgi:hypothetical protein
MERLRDSSRDASLRGGQSSSHKSGSYKNTNTANRYQKRQRVNQVFAHRASPDTPEARAAAIKGTVED